MKYVNLYVYIKVYLTMNQMVEKESIIAEIFLNKTNGHTCLKKSITFREGGITYEIIVGD